MARLWSIHRLAALAILCCIAAGQPGQYRPRDERTTTTQSSSLAASSSHRSSSTPSSTAASSSSTSFSSSSTTAAPAGFTTAVVPVYLVDIAQSLLTQYFPSSTPYALDDVKWPSTVVIGTATYGLQAKATSTKDAKPSSSKSDNSNQKDDKLLAIILGSVLGFIALAIAGTIFFCIRRRKEETGSFFMRRSTPSTSSKGSRIPHVLGGHTAYNGTAGRRLSTDHATATVPLAAGALRHHHSSGSTDSSDEANPFYTPMEHRSAQLSHQELDGRHVERDDRNPPDMQEATNGSGGERPPTPFMPGILRKPVNNPFSSAEDGEADDVVSPILPARSFERASGSGGQMVHYPSMSEVSEFDFAGDGNGRAGSGLGGRGSGNGWLNGRHELM